MTHEQWETLESSLSHLSIPDKLKLIERLVRELRTSPVDGIPAAKPVGLLTEGDFQQHL